MRIITVVLWGILIYFIYKVIKIFTTINRQKKKLFSEMNKKYSVDNNGIDKKNNIDRGNIIDAKFEEIKKSDLNTNK